MAAPRRRARTSTEKLTSHMLALPDAALQRIFDAIAERPGALCRDGLALAAASQRLNRFYREEYVTAMIPHGLKWRSQDWAPHELARALRRLPRAHSLDLAACPGIAEDLRTVFDDTERTESVREIRMRHLPVQDSIMCYAINRMPHLLAIDLSGTKVRDIILHRLIETRFETLRELSLSKVQISDDAGKRIGALRNLQHLNLSACSSLTDITFQELVNLERLETLNLQDTQISSNDIIAALAIMQRLVSLNVCACGELSSRIIPHFPSSLRKLFISQTKILAGLYDLVEIPHLIFYHLPSLKVLSAEYMDDFYELSYFSSLAPQLRELRIPYNGLSDLTTSVLESMESLEILDVAGCDAIGDVTASRAANLPKLQSLDMSATQITNEGIKCLTRSTGPLLSVELYNCALVHNQDGAVDALRVELQRKGGSGVWWDYGELSEESAHEEDGDYVSEGELSAGELHLDWQNNAPQQE
jgi:hypothetical protein